MALFKSVGVLGSQRFIASFTSHEAGMHTVQITFNGDTVPVRRTATHDGDRNLEVEPALKKSKKSKAEKVPYNEVEATSKTFTEADCDTTVTEKEIERTKKSKKSKRNVADESQSSVENKSSNETNIAIDSHNPDSEIAPPKRKSNKNREKKQIAPCDDDATPPPLAATNQQSTNLFEAVSVASNQAHSPEVVTDNVYEIRRYRTEIFRYVDLHAFPNSTLIDIPGYGYTNEMTLKIVDKDGDGRLINTLWNDAMDKYANGKKKKRNSWSI